MIISGASGKGGTGKTTVAVSLALSVSGEADIAFFDCDVEEPNAHIFLKPEMVASHNVEIPVPDINEKTCTHCGDCARICRYNAIIVMKDRVLVFDNLCHGCGGCTLLCPVEAIRETGKVIGTVQWGRAKGIAFTSGTLAMGEVLSPRVIKETKKLIDPNKVNIIDCPPGTSCPVVESVKGSSFCLLVTEPTPFGLNDLKISHEVLRELNIPSGVVINKASDRYDAKIEAFCESAGIDVLMKIPWDVSIARGYSEGIPLIDTAREWKERFAGLFKKVKRGISKTEPQMPAAHKRLVRIDC
ncbi:MAG: ATP-binding protein [Pseudomonadota bacterium]